MRILSWTLAVVLGASLPAFAEDEAAPVDKRENKIPRADDPAMGGSIEEVHKEGEYGGVTPGKAPEKPAKAPGAKKAKKQAGPMVTWVGFQMVEGGTARVFVQTTQEVAYEQNVVGDTLVVFLPGARLNTRNNARFLDTSFFDSRVARVEVRVTGRKRGEKKGIAVIVHFKKGGAAQASAKSEASPDGASRFLFLDFAP
jgi:hypothetical protein